MPWPLSKVFPTTCPPNGFGASKHSDLHDYTNTRAT